MIKVDELKMDVYNDECTNISKAFSAIYEYKGEIETILNNGNWQGASQEMCKAVLAAVDDYLKNFYSDYQDLHNAINELCGDVGTFVSDSSSVQKLS